MRQQTGSRNRGWLPSIGNRLSVAAGVALVAGMMAGTAQAWSPALLASGGNTNYIWYAAPTVAYGVHVYTNTSGGTFTPLAGSLNVEYLVVAGGGGGGGTGNGGWKIGGGGGAGGMRTNSPSLLAIPLSPAQTITVGVGGPAGNPGQKGGDSSIGGLVIAKGGGGGNTFSGGNQNGGSGGGATFWSNTPGTGEAGQGYAGGKYTGADGNNRCGGGGGGAGDRGNDGVEIPAGNGQGGNGGPGLPNGITGTDVWYAGGGGGGANGINGTASGSGGGGSAPNGLGTDGKGGGGGGGQTGGKGGSGIVVIRYLIPYNSAPVIENKPVTGVTTTSATFNGLLTDTNTSATTVCVLWGPQNGGLTWSGWANTNWFDGNGWANNTSFSTNITGLTPDITYYYTYAAVNGSSNAVAPGVKTFITGAVTVNATDSGAQYKVPPIDTGAYTIYRPVTATNEALTVNYALSGSATNGVHYTLSGSATIGAGATSTVLTVTPTYVGSGGNAAVLTLTTGANYTYQVGVSPNDQATVAISSPDLPATFLVVTNGTPGVTPTEPYGTWATAATNIQTAVDFAVAVAATHPTFNTVTVSNGTYNLATQILITNAVTVRSFGNGVYGGLANASNTIVQTGGTHIFTISAAGAVVDGLTIQKFTSSVQFDGGAVKLTGGGLVQNCIIQDNGDGLNHLYGAGIYVTGGGTVSNCVIRRNKVNVGNAYGGGVYLTSGLITHCQILNNTNNNIYGGGIYMDGASAILRNCLIAGNYAAGTDGPAKGGGVYIGTSGGAIQSCTIVTNKAASGNGGVFLDTAGTVSNSIVYWNYVGGTHSNLNTTVGLGNSCSINPGTTANGNIMDDPLFTSLAGGDYTLQKTSTCVDKGSYQTWMTGAKDLAGNLRIQNAGVDMGAYETFVPPKGTMIMLR